MSHTLEQRYRRLLRCYPKVYRARRADEIVDTLLESSRPGQRRPTLREARALVIGGLRARTGADQQHTTAAVWAGGAHLATLVLLAYAAGFFLDLLLFPLTALHIVEVALAAALTGAALVATVAGRRGWALPLIGLTLVVDHQDIFGPVHRVRDYLQALASDDQVLWPLLIAAGLTAVLLRRSTPRAARPAWWLAAIPVAAITLPTQLPAVTLPWQEPSHHPWILALLALQIPLLLLVVLVCTAWSAVDARAPFAAAAVMVVFLAPQFVAVILGWSPLTVPLVAGVALIVILPVTLGAVRAPRQARL